MEFSERAWKRTACFLIGVIPFLVVSCVSSTQNTGAPEAKDETVVEKKEVPTLEGKIKKASSEAKNISITAKESVVVFKFNEGTVFYNAGSVKDLKPDEEVIITYKEEGPEKIAVTITKALARIPEGVSEIKTPELLNLLSAQQAGKDFLLIDSRPAKKYQEAHLPGAVSIPFSEIKAKGGEALLPIATKDIHLIFYCGGNT